MNVLREHHSRTLICLVRHTLRYSIQWRNRRPFGEITQGAPRPCGPIIATNGLRWDFRVISEDFPRQTPSSARAPMQPNFKSNHKTGEEGGWDFHQHPVAAQQQHKLPLNCGSFLHLFTE